MAFCELPLDLLAQPVEDWAERYFDRPVSGYGSRAARNKFENSCEDLSEYEGDLPEPPLIVLLTQVAELHERYAEWTPHYSAEQLNQGLWAMFSYPGDYAAMLYDEEAPFELRARAMRSLVVPYREFVKGWNPHEAIPNGWFMLWDLVLKNSITVDMKEIALECLQEILAIDDGRCQSAALHGLNHLSHPKRSAVVQSWIDHHRQEDFNLEWVEACRDGRAM